MDWTQGPKMLVVWEVLEVARESGNRPVINACVRLIDADRRSWRKQSDDWMVFMVIVMGARRAVLDDGGQDRSITLLAARRRLLRWSRSRAEDRKPALQGARLTQEPGRRSSGRAMRVIDRQHVHLRRVLRRECDARLSATV